MASSGMQVLGAPAGPIAITHAHMREKSHLSFHRPQHEGSQEPPQPLSANTVCGRDEQFHQPDTAPLLHNGELNTLVHALGVATPPCHSSAPPTASMLRHSCPQCMQESATEAAAEHMHLLPALERSENSAEVLNGTKQSSGRACSTCGGGSSGRVAPQQRLLGAEEALPCTSSQGRPKHQGSRVGAWCQLSALSRVVGKVFRDPHLLLLSLWWVAVSGPVMVFTESYCSNLFAGAPCLSSKHLVCCATCECCASEHYGCGVRPDPVLACTDPQKFIQYTFCRG